jgi:glucose/arabinose dehydrogenase
VGIGAATTVFSVARALLRPDTLPRGSFWCGARVTVSEGERFRATVLARELQQPIALVCMPDGRALLAERKAARIGDLQVNAHLMPLEGSPVALNADDARILHLALHPDYAINGWRRDAFGS